MKKAIQQTEDEQKKNFGRMWIEYENWDKQINMNAFLSDKPIPGIHAKFPSLLEISALLKCSKQFHKYVNEIFS